MVDGPVRGREHLPRVLGFIKSHQIAYLEPRSARHGRHAAAGERTPVFLLGTQLGPLHLVSPAALSGRPALGRDRPRRVRAPTCRRAEAIALADLSQAVLPRFASAEYKDPRAPQNLYPVAGLERELRRRLGIRPCSTERCGRRRTRRSSHRPG